MAETRALIVDDEPLARRGVRQLLAAYPEVEVAGECRDGTEALRALRTLKPGLVFLDVQMPGLDGLEVIRLHGAGRMPPTIFVTAHDEFAVNAFDAHALDYLVKPLSEARFRAAMNRFRERTKLADAASLASRLVAMLGGPEAAARAAQQPLPGRIAVRTGSGETFIEQHDIAWITAEDYYSVLSARGRQYRVREPLADLEARLDPARFIRIHRAAIVRLDLVRELRDGTAGTGMAAVMADGTELPVSRRRQARVRAMMRG